MPRLSFKGRVFVENHHMAVPFHELIPIREKGLSAKASLQDNLIIHGDNLAALKSLLPLYRGKVKCIYIDPPYNTGKEGWVYNDNVNSPQMREWLGQVVDRDDLTRHDKWCAMMLPRLKLLRELLREDGVIFVSIDDNELHHLRCLMDEVFNEDNFFAILTRRAMHTVRNSSKDFSSNTDYVLAYAREKSWFDADESHYIRHVIDKGSSYPLDDKDGKGKYKLDPIHARNYYEPYRYVFRNGTEWVAPSGRYPAFSQETLRRLEQEGRLVFRGKEPLAKRYLAEVQRGQPPDTLLRPEDVGFNKDGTRELAGIFQKGGIFSQPKPTKLIEFLIGLMDDPEAIVLDSFAGSGSTAHAVLALNKADGGNRRFILVECEAYADNITAERVRRVIKGVPEAKDERLRAGLGGTFSYLELGTPMHQVKLLDGVSLPPWEQVASYVFFTATGQEFEIDQVNQETRFIGRTDTHDVYLLYEPQLEQLKSLALSLEEAQALPLGKRRKLIFAPTKYLDPDFLLHFEIDFMQLPFQIYDAIERMEACS